MDQPIDPEPPGLLTTTIGCGENLLSSITFTRVRTKTSLPPPAPIGTIISKGFSGKVDSGSAGAVGVAAGLLQPTIAVRANRQTITIVIQRVLFFISFTPLIFLSFFLEW